MYIEYYAIELCSFWGKTVYKSTGKTRLAKTNLPFFSVSDSNFKNSNVPTS